MRSKKSLKTHHQRGEHGRVQGVGVTGERYIDNHSSHSMEAVPSKSTYVLPGPAPLPEPAAFGPVLGREVRGAPVSLHPHEPELRWARRRRGAGGFVHRQNAHAAETGIEEARSTLQP